jgi:hypothetical protein
MASINSRTKFIIFLLKLKTHFLLSNPWQYYHLFARYLPLLMMAHDLKINDKGGQNVNNILSIATISKLFGNYSNTIFPEIFSFLFLFIMFLYFYFFKKFYQSMEKEKSLERKNFIFILSDRMTSFILNTFQIIFIFLNQYFYEILFNLFICEKESSNEDIISTSCYSTFRFFTMALGLILIVLLFLTNFVYNLITLNPFFFSSNIIPAEFNKKNYFFCLLPLLQGYLAIEKNLPTMKIFIIRLSFRGIFVLYMIRFYFNIFTQIYANKFIFKLIILINSFCLVSILLEFFPPVIDALVDVKFILIKFLLQGVISYSIVLIIFYKEEMILTKASADPSKKNMNIFELFSKQFYILLNYKASKSKNIRMLLNKFFEHRNQCTAQGHTSHFNYNSTVTPNNQNNINCVCRKYELEEINKLTKEFFKERSKLEYTKSNIHRCDIINKKLDYYLLFLDDTLINFIQRNEKGKEIYYIKYVFLYIFFLFIFKKNQIYSLFYLEKISRTKIFSSNFLIRFYVLNLKLEICDFFKENNLNKSRTLANFKKMYKNVQKCEVIGNALVQSTDKLKELLLKFGEKNIPFEDFHRLIEGFFKSTKLTNFQENLGLKRFIRESEDFMIKIKLKLFNELIFQKEQNNNDYGLNRYMNSREIDCDIISESGEETTKSLLTNSQNNDQNDVSLSMILHLDKSGNLVINKVSKRLLEELRYNIQDLIDLDISILLPSMIRDFHRERVFNFAKNNKNSICKEIFFMTKDNYALLLTLKCCILPTFKEQIIFFCVFEKEYNRAGQNKNRMNSTHMESDQNMPTYFTVLSKIGDMMYINREFEEAFSISNKAIEILKPNLLTKVFKINPEKTFQTESVTSRNKRNSTNVSLLNNYYVSQMKMKNFIKNLKELNFSDFREYSQELYTKLIKNFKKYKNEAVKNLTINFQIVKVFLENRHLFYVKMTFDKNIKIYTNNDDINGSRYIKGSPNQYEESYGDNLISLLNSNVNASRNQNIQKHISKNNLRDGNDQNHLSYLSADRERDRVTLIENVEHLNKVDLINNEIFSMSKNMLKKSYKLWTSQLSITDVIDKTNSNMNKQNRNFQNANIKISKAGKKIDLRKNQMDRTKYNNGPSIINLINTGKFFQNKKLIFLIIFLIFYLSLFYFILGSVYQKYLQAVTFFSINQSVQNLKNSLILTTFTVLKMFMQKNSILKNSSTSEEIIEYSLTNKQLLESYLNDVNDALYSFRILLTSLQDYSNNDESLVQFKQHVNAMRVYKEIHYDFSIYNTTMSIVDSTISIKTQTGLIYSFSNLSLSQTPEEFLDLSKNVYYNINYQLLKPSMLSNTIDIATEGDRVIYFLVNNFINTMLPVYDSLIVNNLSSLEKSVQDSKLYSTLLNLSLIVGLLLIFIFLIFYFYSSKRHLYEKYFILFNQIRFYNLYIFQKAKLLQDLLVNFNEENYLNLKTLAFEVNLKNQNSRSMMTGNITNNTSNTGNKENTGYNLIRFDLDHNSLLLTTTPNALSHSNIKDADLFKEKRKQAIKNTYNPIKDNSQNNGSSIMNMNVYNNFNNISHFVEDGGKSKNIFPPDSSYLMSNNLISHTPHSTNLMIPNQVANSNVINTTIQNTQTQNNITQTNVGETKQDFSTFSMTLNETKANLRNYSSNKTNKKGATEETDINLKNLLKRPVKFYLDIYYILIIILLIISLNVYNYSTANTNFDNINYITTFNEVVLESAYSCLEISLIYVVSLLKNKEIYGFSDQTNSLFDLKSKRYGELKNLIQETINSNKKAVMKNLIDYESTILSNIDICPVIKNQFLQLYPDGSINTNYELCEQMSSIYSSGLFQGFDTIISNIQKDYLDEKHINFSNFIEMLNGKYLGFIFQSQSAVLGVNAKNIQELVKKDYNLALNSVQLNLSLSYIFSTLLFILLGISYYFIFFVLLKKKYKLIHDVDKIINNIIKHKF